MNNLNELEAEAIALKKKLGELKSDLLAIRWNGKSADDIHAFTATINTRLQAIRKQVQRESMWALSLGSQRSRKPTMLTWDELHYWMKANGVSAVTGENSSVFHFYKGTDKNPHETYIAVAHTINHAVF